MAASLHASERSMSDLTGQFDGGKYKISYRDTNALLSITLSANTNLYGQPGAMVAMSPEVTMKGKHKFSLKKIFTGGETTYSQFTGPGEILLAPSIWGDIMPIYLDGKAEWNVGKGGTLAQTEGVVKERKSQGFSKGLFSGEGLFIDHVSGTGIIFVTSLGAITRQDLREGEQWIVDNGHLVAWNCPYSMERSGGGIISGMRAGEGLVCRFTGPGTIFLQTRNPDALGAWIAGQRPS